MAEKSREEPEASLTVKTNTTPIEINPKPIIKRARNLANEGGCFSSMSLISQSITQQILGFLKREKCHGIDDR